MDTVREGLRGGCAEASLGSLAQQRDPGTRRWSVRGVDGQMRGGYAQIVAHCLRGGSRPGQSHALVTYRWLVR